MSQELAYRERQALDELRAKLAKIGRFFSNARFPYSEDPAEWYAFLATFKEDLGNINNSVSFLGTLMAKEFLKDRFELRDFDAAAKPQGAPGLDIDVRTSKGSRVIAEVKTTSPYKPGDLGAKQADAFARDAEKLTTGLAEHKFFFVTEPSTFEVFKKPKYRNMFKDVRIVLLPRADEIAA